MCFGAKQLNLYSAFYNTDGACHNHKISKIFIKIKTQCSLILLQCYILFYYFLSLNVLYWKIYYYIANTVLHYVLVLPYKLWLHYKFPWCVHNVMHFSYIVCEKLGNTLFYIVTFYFTLLCVIVMLHVHSNNSKLYIITCN